jgi:hypothetical protein
LNNEVSTEIHSGLDFFFITKLPVDGQHKILKNSSTAIINDCEAEGLQYSKLKKRVVKSINT